MSALLDSLAAVFDGDERRKAALAAVLRAGLPGARSEAWKYTSLRALERRAFATPDPVPDHVDHVGTDVLAAIPSPRIVFVNGSFDATCSDLSALPEGVTASTGDVVDFPLAATTSRTGAEDVFAQLNAALSRQGVLLRVASGARPSVPLHLVHVGVAAAEDQAWHLRHRIELGAGASLGLVEHQLADGEHRHLENGVMSVRLAAGARLEHVRIQSGAAGATGFLRTDAVLGEASRYVRVDLELGAVLSRHELNVRLEGDGGQLVGNGVLLAAGKRHLDTRLDIEHVARDTSCALQWRGIGAGRGRAVFHGGITIHAGADGSDARLSNKNLLLDDGAEIDTQPVLVIHADEVQAAHGATVGQLDPTALFYLRTRGLPLDDARRLLTAAFVREPLLALASETMRDFAQARLDAALQAQIIQ
ncbi:Fe-S cluster assembly protein SufD [soil metagenome]